MTTDNASGGTQRKTYDDGLREAQNIAERYVKGNESMIQQSADPRYWVGAAKAAQVVAERIKQLREANSM